MVDEICTLSNFVRVIANIGEREKQSMREREREPFTISGLSKFINFYQLVCIDV